MLQSSLKLRLNCAQTSCRSVLNMESKIWTTTYRTKRGDQEWHDDIQNSKPTYCLFVYARVALVVACPRARAISDKELERVQCPRDLKITLHYSTWICCTTGTWTNRETCVNAGPFAPFLINSGRFGNIWKVRKEVKSSFFSITVRSMVLPSMSARTYCSTGSSGGLQHSGGEQVRVCLTLYTYLYKSSS